MRLVGQCTLDISEGARAELGRNVMIAVSFPEALSSEGVIGIDSALGSQTHYPILSARGGVARLPLGPGYILLVRRAGEGGRLLAFTLLSKDDRQQVGSCTLAITAEDNREEER